MTDVKTGKGDRATIHELVPSDLDCMEEPEEESSPSWRDLVKVDNILIDRESKYGNPVRLFCEIARSWTFFLKQKVEPWDVCLMMARLKLERLNVSKSDDDLYDAIGYTLLYKRVREAYGRAEAEERDQETGKSCQQLHSDNQ